VGCQMTRGAPKSTFMSRFAAPVRVLLSLLAFECACVSTKPMPSGTKAQELLGADASTPVPFAPAKPKAPPGAPIQTLHPNTPGQRSRTEDFCRLIYSTCIPARGQCTSAALELFVPCGEESQVPGKAEWVRCVCS
jgi:hypothetical protein